MIIGVCVGMTLMALVVPLYTGKIPPNPAYGLRTSATCDDEWVWYEANAKSGRELMARGSAIVAVFIALELAGV